MELVDAGLRESWRAIGVGWLVILAGTALLAWWMWPQRRRDGTLRPATYPIGLVVGGATLGCLMTVTVYVASRAYALLQ